MEEYVYRFRSTSTLLGGFHELENQEIYFASPQELNDPLEGFKEIFWRGNEIVWTNLLRHYLLCLTQSVLATIVCGPSHGMPEHEIPIFQTEDALPSSIKALFHDICTKFFQNADVAALPALLAKRSSPVRRNELLTLLWFLHLYALKVTCVVISPENPICTLDRSLRANQDGPFRFQQVFSAQESVGHKRENSGNLVEVVSSHVVSAINQTIIINAYNEASQQHGLAWNTISSEFPVAYINQIERLLHFDWYTACFVGTATNAAMWGNYGDRHRGVCLKFKTELNAAGKSSVVLHLPDSGGANQATSHQVHRDPHRELCRVDYQSPHVEIDFFRSMGRLTPPQLAFWFKTSNGDIGTTGRDALQEFEVQPEEYWSKFDKTMTTKVPDWGHEDEYRITDHSMITDLSDKSARRLRYRFGDLRGIIFGMRTPLRDLLAIMRIIESKCKNEGRKDFEFAQACYSSQTRKMEIEQLPLLKCN